MDFTLANYHINFDIYLLRRFPLHILAVPNSDYFPTDATDTQPSAEPKYTGVLMTHRTALSAPPGQAGNPEAAKGAAAWPERGLVSREPWNNGAGAPLCRESPLTQGPRIILF